MSSDTKTLPQDDCVSHFDSKASNWSELYKRACFVDRLSLFVSKAVKNVSAGSHILDYGCGTGILARALHEEGFIVSGVDASRVMIEEAQREASSESLRAEAFRHIDSESWPDTAEMYDGIVCSSVLEYIDDHELMLGKLSSRIRPGGTLIISVPNSSSLVGRLEDAYNKLSTSRRERDVEFCKRRYSAEEFSDRLKHVGIETKNIEYFEMPRLGQLGVRLSRLRPVGVMMIVTGSKMQQANEVPD